GSLIADLLGLAAPFGAGSAPMRVTSWFHWVLLRALGTTMGVGGVLPAPAECAALAVVATSPATGRKPTWMWFQCSGIASVLGAPGYCIRLMIWCGTNSPCSVSSARIVRSV